MNAARRPFWVLLLLLLTAVQSLEAQTESGLDDVLLRNVTLIDENEQALEIMRERLARFMLPAPDQS